jgi:ubiquinone/menaquinone biosynthesis C-methylase UbiE
MGRWSYDNVPLAVGGDTATAKNLSLRLRLMKQHIAPGNFVLDVGCGRADYLRMLLSNSPNIVGIETAKDKLDDCFRAHPELRNRVLHVSAESMPFPTAHFDVVIVNEVLEHIPDQDAALREIHRVLKPGGKFLLFCPNRLFPFETHGLMIRGVMRMWIPAIHYLPGSLCRVFKIEPVARNYWPKEVSKLLQLYGFQVRQKAFVQQTFENISGAQPLLVKAARPALRLAVRMLGKMPVLRAFVSVSSFFVASADAPMGRQMAG